MAKNKKSGEMYKAICPFCNGFGFLKNKDNLFCYICEGYGYDYETSGKRFKKLKMPKNSKEIEIKFSNGKKVPYLKWRKTKI